MTITCLPIDASAGAPAYTAQNTRQAFSSLLFNGTARPLGSQSGAVPGRVPTVTASSTLWSVGAGAFVVDPAFTVTQGPYLVSIDAAVTGSMTAANASLARIDALDLQISDTAIDSSGARQASIVPVTGAPAASPVAPAYSARSVRIAVINVPASGGGSPTVTMFPQYAVASGAILPINSAATRDAVITNPSAGMAVYRLDTGNVELYEFGNGWMSKPSKPQTASRYYRTAGYTISVAPGRSVIPLDTKHFDYSPGGALYNTSTSAWTAPETGLYQVNMRAAMVLNNNPQDYHVIAATSNAFTTEYFRGSRITVRGGTGGDPTASVGSDIVPIAAGGTLVLGVYNGGSNALALTPGLAETFLSIVKVG